MAKGQLNWGWLERRMERLGITYHYMRKKLKPGISQATLNGWDRGTEAKPDSLLRLARVLGVTVGELVRQLGVKPMRIERRKAVGRRLAKARKAAQA